MPRRLLFLIVFGLILCAVFPSAPRERRLEDGATVLVRDFGKALGSPDYTLRCVWRDDKTMLVASAKKGEAVVSRLSLPSGIVEAVPMPIPAKRTVARRSGVFFAPDAAYLLWLERDPAAPPPTAYATGAQTPSVTAWRGATYVRRPVWLDSRRWAQIMYAHGGQEVRVYDIRNPTRSVSYRIVGTADLRDLLTATSDGSIYAYGESRTTGKSGTVTQNRVVRLDTRDGKNAVARETVSLPPDKWYIPVNVSRTGQRVLWLELQTYRASVGWQQVWEDFADRTGLSQFFSTPRRLSHFWTSTAGGQDMHLLGREPIDKRRPYQVVTRVIWTPDEKHVSYIFGNSLYYRAVP